MSRSTHSLSFHGRRAVLTALVAAWWSVPALAANLGIVHGSVHDEAGHPIPATEVKLLRGTVQVDAHPTDSTGHFEFEQVPFGKYRLTFTAPDGRMDDREVLIASGDVLELDVTLPTLEETVTVTAPKREAPRPASTTSSATQIQREDILALPRGDTASVNDVLATQPGFVFDSLGQLYVRGNHGNVQFQVDGVPLPESVSGLFGQFLTPKLVENLEVITGGLPAEYGLRLSAVVNLNSRRPPPEGEGQAELLYGSYNTWTPSAFWGQKLGSVSYMTGGSFTWTNRGIDPPNPATYVWDKSQQGRVFGKVDVDFNDRDHLTTLIAYSHNQFQIPVDPTQQPGATAPDAYGNPPAPYFPPNSQQTEGENDLFGIVSYRHDFDTAKSLRVAAFFRYSTASFFGDPSVVLGPSQEPCTVDIECRGVSNLDRRATDVGLVADYLQRIGDRHTLKFGIALNQLWGTSSYQAYSQLTPPPPYYGSVGQGTDSPKNTTGGAYVQDRWAVGKLTLTGGLRVDFQTVSVGGASTTEVGVSPRLGAAWAFTPDVVAHAFVGLLWIPPSVLDVAAGARLTNAVPPNEPIPYTLKPEKDTYAELGDQGPGGPGAVARAHRLGTRLQRPARRDGDPEHRHHHAVQLLPGPGGGHRGHGGRRHHPEAHRVRERHLRDRAGQGDLQRPVPLHPGRPGEPGLADAGPRADLDRERRARVPGGSHAGLGVARVRERAADRRRQRESRARLGPGRPDTGA